MIEVSKVAYSQHRVTLLLSSRKFATRVCLFIKSSPFIIRFFNLCFYFSCYYLSLQIITGKIWLRNVLFTHKARALPHNTFPATTSTPTTAGKPNQNVHFAPLSLRSDTDSTTADRYAVSSVIHSRPATMKGSTIMEQSEIQVLEKIDITGINENTLYFFFKSFSKEPFLIKQELEYLSTLETETIIKVTEMKRQLYSKKFDTEEIASFIKLLKTKNQSFYELICLATVVSCYKSVVNHYHITILKTVRKRKVRTKTLEEKIKLNLTEIDTYREQGHKWQDIPNLLKKNHKRQFDNFKLDYSYLRKVYNKLKAK